MSLPFCHSETEATQTMLCPVMPWYHDAPVSCMGQRCMAWRWVATHIPNPQDPHGQLVLSEATHGFCGMAVDPRANR